MLNKNLVYVIEAKADAELFAVQQKEDGSLFKCWNLSKEKGQILILEFVVINSLLWRVR